MGIAGAKTRLAEGFPRARKAEAGSNLWRPQIGGTTMIVTILYYGMAAFIAVLLIWNFMKSRKLQDEILYVIVLVPFVLRLLRLK